MRKWKIAAAAAVAAAAVAGAVGLTPMIGPASASTEGAYSTSFVDGGGALTDDWGDHYSEIGNSLCHGCANSWNTDTVLMWQAILVAEGLLSHSALDGKFGSNTAAATKKWQTRYWLTADGKVGRKTWDKADDRLRWGRGQPYYDGWAASGKVLFTRGGPWSSYGNGSYELGFVMDDDETPATSFEDSNRIHHKKRTVTVDRWK